MEYAHKFMLVYDRKSREAAKEFGLTQTAFDILLFLANNPDYHTARDIVEVRKLKANLVSVNVEKLVQEGYLFRKKIPEDRRKIGLYLTDKAGPVIEKGRAFQNSFFAEVSEGIGEEDRERLYRIMKQTEQNINRMLEETN